MRTLISLFLILGLTALVGCDNASSGSNNSNGTSDTSSVGKSLEKKKEQFKKKWNESLVALDKKIEQLEVKKDEAKDAAKVQYEMTIKELKAKRGTVQKKLEEVDEIADDEWDDFTDGAQDVWDDFSDAVNDAWDKLDK